MSGGLALTIVNPKNEVLKKDLNLAMTAAKRANELTEGKDAAIVDTLAKVFFDCGKLEKALELQKRALDLAERGSDLEAELKGRLQQYEQAIQN